MQCQNPTCDSTDSKVYTTEKSTLCIVRYRQCLTCGQRWTTTEYPTKLLKSKDASKKNLHI